MTKRQNSIVALFMAATLFFGYMLPTMVTAAEDSYLLMERKEYEIEEVRLNSTEIDFFEELSIFSELMYADLKVKKSEVNQEEGWICNRAKEIVNDFLTMINESHTTELQSVSVTSIAMVDWSGENVYPFWQCLGIDEKEDEYIFWIDEITGKIIAFDIPDDFMTLNGQKIDELMEILAGYYGVTVEYDLGNWYDVNGYDIEVKKEAEGIFYFLNEESDRKIYLPFHCYAERIVFNMYKGAISIYDSVKKGI